MNAAPLLRMTVVLALAALSGCAVTLHGQQSSGPGGTTITTGSAVRAAAQSGNARVSASFGSPPPANAAGGQATFSRGASAALVLGLAVAGVVDSIGQWFRPPAERREPLAPGGISHTCSCYGWQPELTPAPEPQ